MNLTKINGWYSKELRESCNDLKLLLNEKTVTTKQMKEFVIGIIEPAFINANAKKRFIKNLNDCNTKSEVDELCRLAVTHGMYYTPKKRTI